MDSLCRLLSTALLPPAILRHRTKPLASDSSALSKLPPELILRIASLLPPTSAAALSLCTKKLHFLLSTPYLKCPHGHPPFTPSSFLQLLSPSLPDHIACHHCEKLHAIKRAKRHIQYTKRCDAKVNEAMRSYIHPRFSYVVLQMAMKRYRQGRGYASLLDLLSYEEWSWVGPGQTKAEARIVDGALLLRQQHTVLVHPNGEFSLLYSKIPICPHAKHLCGKVDYQKSAPEKYSMVYTTGSVDIDRSPTAGAAECTCSSHEAKKYEGDWPGLVRCRECATEFRVDTLGVGKEGKAFVVTRWKDLGEGREVGDPVWRAHLREGVVGGSKREEGRRSICERFEGKGWRGGLEELVTPREMKRLVRFRYCFCGV